MNPKRIGFILIALFCLMATVQAQSPAALQKLNQKFNVEQLAEMQRLTNYKYEGLLLYYSESFLVSDNGITRAATEQEISAVDIDQYRELRNEKASVAVHDAILGKELVLLSRAAFEKIVLARLSDADATAYLAYKSQALATQGKSTE
jgi:hypothetical protein